MGLTTQLSAELVAIDQLTDRDRERLQVLVLDFIAAAYAGYRVNYEFNRVVANVMLGQGGRTESAVFLSEVRLPAERAAFLNALYGHGADLDDGHKRAMGHCGVHVIPAVFALAEATEARNEEVLRALAVGYEAYVRLSSAAQPGMVERGFHSTGMAGTLACAAACGRLLGLDVEGMENAIAVATTLSGGLLSYGDSRPAVKPLNPAHAAANGLFAARLAADGIRGPEAALEGPNGWFHAVTERYNAGLLRGKDHLLLHDCYLKLWPSCRHTHCCIDAALRLRRRLGDGVLTAEAVDSIRVCIYPNAIKLAGQIRYPQEADQTKFSIHYTLATALLRGNYGIEDLHALVRGSDVERLIDKIRLEPDVEMEDSARGIRGARVELTMADGRRMEETVLSPKGDPEVPLNYSDVVEKLKACSQGIAGPKALQRHIDRVERLALSARFCNPLGIATDKEIRTEKHNDMNVNILPPQFTDVNN
ncbi:MAG: MmgE/PrpD family protein [Bacteroidales bacterium]|nr:MmgE/PrpD family protein [Bacteroidales bacterium]